MKDMTIYKNLKIKNGSLVFNKDVLYTFKNSSFYDEMIIEDTIIKLKKNLYPPMKNSISDAIDYRIDISESLVIVHLKCKDKDGHKYTGALELVTLVANRPIWL